MSSIQQKITSDIKSQENITQDGKKAKSIVTDPEITQMTESVDEDMEKVMTHFICWVETQKTLKSERLQVLI